jgi:HAD superfamily hydrolase (TIGR01509 family)
MIRALIFDFDGLILETELPYYQSVRELYQQYQCEVPPELFQGIGSADLFDPYEYLARQMGHPVDRQRLSQERRQRHFELVTANPVLPGVPDYLKEAKRMGLRVGLASSSSREWVTGHLSRVGLLSFFEVIRCADDVTRTKPDPELFRAVLTAFQLEPDQALVFEDSLNGVSAARQAGTFCVAVPSHLTRQFDFSQAHLRLNSLADLPLRELLARIQG